MGRSQRNDNFIDKTFTLLADILLKVFPASKQEKQAFFYYRDGMSAQAEGDYACLLYTSPSPRDATLSRMPSSA